MWGAQSRKQKKGKPYISVQRIKLNFCSCFTNMSLSLLLLIIITKISRLIFSRSGGCYLTVKSTTTIRKTWQQPHDRFGPSLPTPMASHHPLSPYPQTSKPPSMFQSEQVYPNRQQQNNAYFHSGESLKKRDCQDVLSLSAWKPNQVHKGKELSKVNSASILGKSCSPPPPPPPPPTHTHTDPFPPPKTAPTSTPSLLAHTVLLFSFNMNSAFSLTHCNIREGLSTLQISPPLPPTSTPPKLPLSNTQQFTQSSSFHSTCTACFQPRVHQRRLQHIWNNIVITIKSSFITKKKEKIRYCAYSGRNCFVPTVAHGTERGMLKLHNLYKNYDGSRHISHCELKSCTSLDPTEFPLFVIYHTTLRISSP